MEFILIGLITALAVSSALRRSRERATRYSGYYVSTSYRARCARAPSDKSARAEFRSIAKKWK
jgi:hypothetical protein